MNYFLKRISIVFSILIAVTAVTPSFGASADKATSLRTASDQPSDGGYYDVWVEQGNEWGLAGSRHFNKIPGDAELDLSHYMAEGQSATIRLTKRGGGNAHIDVIRLGGSAPVLVDGETGFGVDKLSAKDNDVTEVLEDGVIAEFSADRSGNVLTWTARVENAEISKTPFHFPLSNMYKMIREYSEFYIYQMNSNYGSLSIDGVLDEVADEEPFFKEYSKTGSGHPSGFTYGWVRNDAENLYVTIDFTPDNTTDDEKDYTKVYVKTAVGVKEFKSSVPETEWGTPFFTYTDKVNYQHKVYEYKIPLAELGVSGSDEVELPLAFAAYGTATPPVFFDSRLAYNSNGYLHVYEDHEAQHLNGMLINDQGSPVSGPFSYAFASVDMYQSNQFDVAYDPESGKYLLVWEAGARISGMWINEDGTETGEPFTIDDEYGTALAPSVAYDPANRWFAVAYQVETGIGSNNIGVSLIDPQDNRKDYVSLEDSATIADIDIIYDDGVGKFLLAWMDYEVSEVHGKYLFWDASALYHEEAVSREIGSGNGYHLELAYDSVKDRTAVFWESIDVDDNSTFSVTTVTYGAMDTFPASPVSLPFSSNSMYNDFDVAFDAQRETYAIVWETSFEYHDTLKGTYIDAESFITDRNYKEIAMSDNPMFSPYLVNNPGSPSHFLLAYAIDRFYTEEIKITDFDAMPPLHIRDPVLSYDPDSESFIMVSSSLIHENIEVDDYSVDVRMVTAEGKVKGVNHVAFYNQFESSYFSVDHGIGGRHLAVWSEEENGIPFIKGQFFNSDGTTEENSSFEIASYAYLPTVKFDPVNGHFVVAYVQSDYYDEELAIHAVTVGLSDEVSDPENIGALSADYSWNPSERFLLMEYDSNENAMFVVWKEIFRDISDSPVRKILAQYMEYSETGLQSAGQQLHLYQDTNYIKSAQLGFDESTGQMVVSWHLDSGSVKAVTAQLGKEIGELFTLGVNSDSMFVYDPVFEKLNVAWIDNSNGEMKIKLQDFESLKNNEANAIEWAVGESVEEPETDLDLAAASTDDGLSIFYSISTDHLSMEYGLIRISLKDELRHLDGNVNNPISIADVVMYTRRNTTVDNGMIQKLLQYIEPVYDQVEEFR